MNVFAELGYDVWTMDHENYGRSSQTQSNSDIASGVKDIQAGMEVIARETGQQKVHLFGESSGGLRAGAYAMAEPTRVDRLVLGAFTYKGENSPTLTERAKNLDYYRTHNRRLRDRAMIRSIFTRDKAGHHRSGHRGIPRRRRTEVRRSGAHRDVSRHDGQPARGGSEAGDRAGAADPRRIRRHRHHERSDRFLLAAPQRRPPVRGAAGNGALRRVRACIARRSGTPCTRSSRCQARRSI